MTYWERNWRRTSTEAVYLTSCRRLATVSPLTLQSNFVRGSNWRWNNRENGWSDKTNFNIENVLSSSIRSSPAGSLSLLWINHMNLLDCNTLTANFRVHWELRTLTLRMWSEIIYLPLLEEQQFLFQQHTKVLFPGKHNPWQGVLRHCWALLKI